MTNWDNAVQQISEMATAFATRGWLMATCGNLSVKLKETPLCIAITRSGADKQRLQSEDILHVDENLVVQQHNITEYKPSAETLVHLGLYHRFGCGSVVHVHSIYNNLVSDLFGPTKFVHMTEYEFLKALGHWEENGAIQIPIVDNFHDITQLANAVVEAADASVPGVLVRNHGIYAWGESAADARRHLEAFEFLFELHVRRLQVDLLRQN